MRTPSAIQGSAGAALTSESENRAPVVAVGEPIVGVVRERAEELGIPIHAVPVGRDGALLEAAVAPEAAVRGAGMDPRTLRQIIRANPSVRWVHAMLAGVDDLMAPEIVESDIVVTRARGVHGKTVSEFAMGLMLLAAKRFAEMLRAQERREWLDIQPVFLGGATLVIVGYGEIGLALARRAKSFDMRVVGVRRRPRPDGVADEVVGLDRLHEVLAKADYVVLIAPATRDTFHMFGEAEIKAMPKHAHLINVARGSLVDDEVLDRLLRDGQIAGALLDTFSVEPLPPDHPFWANPRVVVTPHAAGQPFLGVRGPVLDQLLENVRRFGQGEPLLNVVDKRLGY